MFQLGEKVIYPQYGLGTISEVTKKSVNGTYQVFYRLEFPIKQLEILVPVSRAEDNGLRRVLAEPEVDELIRFITTSRTAPKPEQWHRWRKKTLEQMKNGDPMDIARIYCYLRALKRRKGLSFTERKIWMQIEQMLISEIAVAKEVGEDVAANLIRVVPSEEEFRAS